MVQNSHESSTGPLAYLFPCSFAPLTRMITRSITHSQACGKVLWLFLRYFFQFWTMVHWRLYLRLHCGLRRRLRQTSLAILANANGASEKWPDNHWSKFIQSTGAKSMSRDPFFVCLRCLFSGNFLMCLCPRCLTVARYLPRLSKVGSSSRVWCSIMIVYCIMFIVLYEWKKERIFISIV